MKKLEPRRVAEIIERMKRNRLVIYGDVMLDEFVWGDVTRISPEAPVPVVDIKRESVRLGGAANVLANIVALGGSATLTGVKGCDRAGERLDEELARLRSSADVNQCNASVNALVIDRARPTTIKTRIIAHNQLVVRADREARTAVNQEIETKLIACLEQEIATAAVLIVSDYDKGAVTPRVLQRVLELAAHHKTFVLIDPKLKNFDSYTGATLVTPNHHEALRFSNTDDASDKGIEQAARLIKSRLKCEAVLVTRGERGMMLLEANDEPLFVETAAREVYDVTGAGDTVIATLGLSLAAGATLAEAAEMANHAAGIVVGKLGTATASCAELIRSFEAESVATK